jgi:hypothetical protein
MAENKSRLTIETTAAVRMRLARLQMNTKAHNMTEVIRRALTLYEAIVNAQACGSTLVLRAQDGSEREVMMP